MQTLAEIGVAYVQGFVVSRSRPPEQILAVKSFESFIAPGPLTDLINKLIKNETLPQGKLIDMERFKESH